MQQSSIEGKMPAPIYPKPIYSYACLVAMALKNSRNGSLLVSEIYDFLRAHFPYFRTAPAAWKNAVRHALSWTVFFKKIDNGGDNNHGRKSVWIIDPAKIGQIDTEIQNFLAKYPVINRKAMAAPDKLPAILRGEMKFDENGSFDDIQSGNDTEVAPKRARIDINSFVGNF